jgi:hypothetical protein
MSTTALLVDESKNRVLVEGEFQNEACEPTGGTASTKAGNESDMVVSENSMLTALRKVEDSKLHETVSPPLTADDHIRMRCILKLAAKPAITVVEVAIPPIAAIILSVVMAELNPIVLKNRYVCLERMLG